ncbi:MAG: ABC transporter ATP-binding protein [Gammaproteobacteria bacterium]|nr:ABC transporter ATP-binding protein [Gammaproteobacteria bacterium]
MSLLRADNLTFGVNGRLLCKGLTFHVEAGECWGVLGPNGSGKTTLLHTLAGLHPEWEGQLTLSGRPLQQLGRRHIARQLGLLLQDSHDPFPATVQETVLSGRHPHLSRWQTEGEHDRRLAHKALERMQLCGMEQRQVQSLSGGERRRLAFATLLTQAPPLLLLDEPLNHLDLRHQQLLLATVRERCAAGDGVIMVLHDPNQAMRYCDRVLLLEGDGNWQQGASREMLTADRLSSLYGCRIESVELAGRRWLHHL